jgi:hypothetical protein
LFGLSACRLDTAASANGSLPARLPFRRLRFFASLLRIQSALVLSASERVCTSRFINRIRFGHRVVLQWGIRASCALPPPKAPPLRRGALGRWRNVWLSNQRRQHERSLRRRSPVRMCESRKRSNHALAETGERLGDSSFGGKFSPTSEAGNSAGNSKANFAYRTASSNPTCYAKVFMHGWRVHPTTGRHPDYR